VGGPNILSSYLVRLWLGCIPKFSFLACLEVPQKFVWWWWVVVESEFSDRLWLSSSLALAKPNNNKLGNPPSPRTMSRKGGIFKSCPRVPKLRI
jgi:hypothetical protein